MIQHVEIVCWRGELETLALRLGCAPAELLSALRALGRDVNRTPIKLDVALANSHPIWAATRRRLASASAGVDGEPGIDDHRLMLGDER